MLERSIESRGLRFLIGAAALVIVVAGLRAADAILVPLILAAFLGILSLPFVLWLRSRRVPQGIAVLLTVAANVGVATLFVFLVTASVGEFVEAAPRYQEWLDWTVGEAGAVLAAYGIDTTGWLSLSAVKPEAVMGLVGKALGGLVSFVSATILVLIVLVFLLFEAQGFPAKVQNALGQQESGRLLWFERVTREVQRYLLIKTLMSLVTGLTVSAWLLWLGIDFPLLLGLLAFLCHFIPNVGALLAAVPAMILAGIEDGFPRAALVALGYLLVALVLGNLIEPYLMGRRLGLSTLVVFVSLVFWGWVWGGVGVLLSVPLTMTIKIVLENTEDLRWVAALLNGSPRAGPALAATAPASTGDKD